MTNKKRRKKSIPKKKNQKRNKRYSIHFNKIYLFAHTYKFDKPAKLLYINHSILYAHNKKSVRLSMNHTKENVLFAQNGKNSNNFISVLNKKRRWKFTPCNMAYECICKLEFSVWWCRHELMRINMFGSALSFCQIGHWGAGKFYFIFFVLHLIFI